MGWLNEISAFRKLRHCGHSKIPPGNSWRPLTVPLSVAQSLWSLPLTEDRYKGVSIEDSRIL